MSFATKTILLSSLVLICLSLAAQGQYYVEYDDIDYSGTRDKGAGAKPPTSSSVTSGL